MKIKARRYYIYYAAKVLFFVIRIIPRRIGIIVAVLLSKCAYRILKRYRDIALSNLNGFFSGDKTRNERIAKNLFANLAKNGIDWIKLSGGGKGYVGRIVTEVQGLSNLDKLLARGKGVVVVSAHIGNWEVLPIYLGVKGYKGAIVARRIYFHKFDEFVTKMRTRYGARVIYRDESPKKMLKLLKLGEILGILADQDVDSVDGVFVEFFGAPAYTPTAPVKIAIASGAGLIPVFVVRKPDDTYKIIVDQPIIIPEGTRDEALIESYTLAWTKVLERYIRDYPDQWVWIHSRWKTGAKKDDRSVKKA